MGPAEMASIAAIIDGAVTARGDAAALARLRSQSEELARAFPLYPEL